MDKVGKLLEKLPSLKDPHSEFALLCSCFSLPKVAFTLRTTPPLQSCLREWKRFDSMVRESLDRVLGSNLDNKAYQQAQLPVSLGGLGLRSAAAHSSSAFLSSSFASEPLMDSLLHPEEFTPNRLAALTH